MCLGVPGQVVSKDGHTGMVKIGDLVVRVGLDLVPEAAVGDHVLVHAGFAIQVINENEAALTWQLLEKMAGP
ncbi:HypC/HybG/HupF family hydrogenase formation chaperone [Neomoorella thermoacetica]|uniref:HypC/HybG/HupF family hydrogenase formation chaperone n=1 Tax=Neomoorella thermoacetica TaxID=1525 RepID=UPI0008FB0CED|nr:HypC/HybG/HupF family hydrogenase formation chaperone [Moorella thermoacetica]APC09245.1 hydrogenase isoenzymes formation protein HypC [Moorella thermoacetica]